MSARKTTAFIPATILLAFLGTGFGVVASHPEMMTSLFSKGAPTSTGTDVSDVSLYLKDGKSICINSNHLADVVICLDAQGTNFNHEGVLNLRLTGALNDYIYPSSTNGQSFDVKSGIYSTSFSLLDSTINDTKAYREFEISFEWFDDMEPCDNVSFRNFASAVNSSSSQFLFDVNFF